ncbi:RcnB family protein [Rhodanobacter geophilus]|uniref:RcnB family protein n=1 Tax=Rhodanobacter geophilus TaxID=3162488 RepID=A0ABV3QMZ7_9GAMM
MKKLLVLAAACGVTLMLASGAALAQDHGNDWGHDHDHHQQDHGHHDRGHDDDRDHGHGDGHAYGHYKSWHDRGMHEGWYRRGGYLPAEYRGPRYVVYDWRAARLREPPRGYHWVRSDTGDFLLVAVTTGVIVDLLLNH